MRVIPIIRSAALACAVCSIFPAFTLAAEALAGEPVTVLSSQIGFSLDEPEKKRFGKLEWIGTLRLGANNRNFGGFSGLVIDKDGENFLAVSDKGYWLRGRIAYADGRPGEGIYRYKNTVASFVHWYFSSDPATVCDWFIGSD